MGHFLSFYSNLYILVCVDYVTKYVEVISCVANDAHTIIKFLKKIGFSRFGVPIFLINHGGKYICNKYLEIVLAKYNVKHKMSTSYHPQIEVSNRQHKQILKKPTTTSRKDWEKNLDDVLCAYMTSF